MPIRARKKTISVVLWLVEPEPSAEDGSFLQSIQKVGRIAAKRLVLIGVSSKAGAVNPRTKEILEGMGENIPDDELVFNLQCKKVQDTLNRFRARSFVHRTPEILDRRLLNALFKACHIVITHDLQVRRFIANPPPGFSLQLLENLEDTTCDAR